MFTETLILYMTALPCVNYFELLSCLNALGLFLSIYLHSVTEAYSLLFPEIVHLVPFQLNTLAQV